MVEVNVQLRSKPNILFPPTTFETMISEFHYGVIPRA